MKHKENAPTMKDVAREAGVALGTVSKVFNNILVGEDYRRRVEEAAKRLGYQVNSYARGLKTNRTCSAALILPNVTAPFFAMLAQEVCSALAQRGYRTVLFTTALCEHRPVFQSQRPLRLLRQLRRRPDGGGKAAGAGLRAPPVPAHRLQGPWGIGQAGGRL